MENVLTRRYKKELININFQNTKKMQTNHPDSILSIRANIETIFPLKSFSTDIGIYENGTNNEHLEAGKLSQHEVFVEFAYGEWDDIKKEKEERNIRRFGTDLFCTPYGMNLIASCGVTRKCEKKYFVPRCIPLESLWNQLSPVICRFIVESSRSFCEFFLSIFYNIYNGRKHSLKAQQDNGLDVDDDEWERRFMTNVRETLEILKLQIRPYVCVRIWYNGTGLGKYDAERVYVEDVKLMEGLNYSVLRHSYKKIKDAKKEFFELYDESVEAEQLNSN